MPFVKMFIQALRMSLFCDFSCSCYKNFTVMQYMRNINMKNSSTKNRSGYWPGTKCCRAMPHWISRSNEHVFDNLFPSHSFQLDHVWHETCYTASTHLLAYTLVMLERTSSYKISTPWRETSHAWCERSQLRGAACTMLATEGRTPAGAAHQEEKNNARCTLCTHDFASRTRLDA